MFIASKFSETGILMSFELPQDLNEWIPLAVPVFTLLIGLIYFFFPKSALGFIGLEGTEKHPEGYGDGRSTFASFAIGLPLCCILLQQPILYQILTLAWIVIAVGRVVHFLLDGGLQHKPAVNALRLVIAGGVAFWSYQQTGLPETLLNPEINMPVGLHQQLPAIAALVTFVFGILCFLTPRWALKLVRMQAKPEVASASGEPRGLLAGLYLALGGMALLHFDVQGFPGVFIGISLGVCWILAAFGRMIAILSDRCNNLFNWVSLLIEIALGLLPLLVVFELLPKPAG